MEEMNRNLKKQSKEGEPEKKPEKKKVKVEAKTIDPNQDMKKVPTINFRGKLSKSPEPSGVKSNLSNYKFQQTTSGQNQPNSARIVISKEHMITKNEHEIKEVYSMDETVIGTGAFGSVTKCIHRTTKQKRACKTVPKKKVI